MTERKDWLGAKLATGYNHLHRIKTEHAALVESKDCGVIADLQADPGYLAVKVYSRRPPSPEWSIHAGEALYQFRSVLDHLACWLTEQNGETVDEDTEFPIFLRREKFFNVDGTLTKGVCKRMGGISADNQAIIEREQPFNRTDGLPEDDPLWLLYQLSNYDRHQWLHLIGFTVSTGYNEFTPSWFARHITRQISSNFGPFEGEAEVSRFEISYDGPQIAVQVKSHVTFEIAFGKEGPAAGLPVVATLRQIGIRVVKIMGRLTDTPLPPGI
jgi:hypothetical protein